MTYMDDCLQIALHYYLYLKEFYYSSQTQWYATHQKWRTKYILVANSYLRQVALSG